MAANHFAQVEAIEFEAEYDAYLAELDRQLGYPEPDYDQVNSRLAEIEA